MAQKPVLLCLIDGLRPDALYKAHAPVLKRLIANGMYTLKAQTVLPSLTLPCISSLFLGVPPEEHGTLSNWYTPGWDDASLIDVFRIEDKTAYAFYNWEQLRDVARPGSLRISVCLNYAEAYDLPLGESDTQLTETALSMLSNFPDFCFAYLGCLDTAGHRHGWMSEEYLRTLENADRCLGQLVEALPKDGLLVVLSDHGGHDFGHGSDLPEDLTIPVILYGAGIVPGEIETPVIILDIAPTIAAFACLPVPESWKGSSLL